MKPYFEQDNLTLYNGDSAEVLKSLDSTSVDLTVTSPPYDNLRTYKGFSFDFETIAKELYRVTKQGGVVIWIVNDATVKGSETGTSFRQALYFMQCGFNLHDTMIWCKDTLLFPDKKRYGQCFEYMFVFSKGSPNVLNKIKDRKNKWASCKIHGTSRLPDGSLVRKANHNKNEVQEYGERFNIWYISGVKNNKTSHPAVFPEQLVKDHILSWSNEGDTVLDPFMGSGTTALAGISLNRKVVGIEISKDYCDISIERVKERIN